MIGITNSFVPQLLRNVRLENLPQECVTQKTSVVLLFSSRVKICGSDNFAQLLDLQALKVTQAFLPHNKSFLIAVRLSVS